MSEMIAVLTGPLADTPANRAFTAWLGVESIAFGDMAGVAGTHVTAGMCQQCGGELLLSQAMLSMRDELICQHTPYSVFCLVCAAIVSGGAEEVVEL